MAIQLCAISKLRAFTLTCVLLLYYLCGSKEFRKEYAALNDMRELLSTDLKLMALTTTATKVTRKGICSICKSLGLLNPVRILKSSEKSNIIYKVIQRP